MFKLFVFLKSQNKKNVGTEMYEKYFVHFGHHFRYNKNIF